MRYVSANYRLYARQLAASLQSAVSMIHFSSDLWTSPHRHGMLAVCGQWVDKSYTLREALLGLLECRSDHSGAYQATLVAKVLEKFEIRRVGYHTGDGIMHPQIIPGWKPFQTDWRGVKLTSIPVGVASDVSAMSLTFAYKPSSSRAPRRPCARHWRLPASHLERNQWKHPLPRWMRASFQYLATWRTTRQARTRV